MKLPITNRKSVEKLAFLWVHTFLGRSNDKAFAESDKSFLCCDLFFLGCVVLVSVFISRLTFLGFGCCRCHWNARTYHRKAFIRENQKKKKKHIEIIWHRSFCPCLSVLITVESEIWQRDRQQLPSMTTTAMSSKLLFRVLPSIMFIWHSHTLTPTMSTETNKWNEQKKWHRRWWRRCWWWCWRQFETMQRCVRYQHFALSLSLFYLNEMIIVTNAKAMASIGVERKITNLTSESNASEKVANAMKKMRKCEREKGRQREKAITVWMWQTHCATGSNHFL